VELPDWKGSGVGMAGVDVTAVLLLPLPRGAITPTGTTGLLLVGTAPTDAVDWSVSEGVMSGVDIAAELLLMPPRFAAAAATGLLSMGAVNTGVAD
jgi:hypothetical protein